MNTSHGLRRSSNARCNLYFEELFSGSITGQPLAANQDCPFCWNEGVAVFVYHHMRDKRPPVLPIPGGFMTPQRGMPGDSSAHLMSPGFQQGPPPTDPVTQRQRWLNLFGKINLPTWPPTAEKDKNLTAEDWIVGLESFASQYINDQADRFEAFNLGISMTDISAREWLALTIPEGTRPSFDEVKRAFLNRFGDRNRMQKLENDFFHLAPPASGREGVDVNNYLSNLQRLVATLGYDKDPMSFLTTYLFRKLSPATREVILSNRKPEANGYTDESSAKTPSHGLRTIAEFMDSVNSASSVVSSLPNFQARLKDKSKSSSSSSSSSSSASYGSVTPCHLHPTGKHAWKDCSQNPSSPTYQAALSRKRKDPSASAASYAPKAVRSNGGPGVHKAHNPNIKCYNCQQTGHISSNCPAKEKSQLGKK